MAEDEQFNKDLARALELSKITAAEDDNRRQRLGIKTTTRNGVNHLLPKSASGSSLSSKKYLQQEIAQSPIPSPTRGLSANKEGPTVRPRPRPTSGRLSPASLSPRGEKDDLFRTSPTLASPWDLPGDRLPASGSGNAGPQAKRTHTTLWEQFEKSDNSTGVAGYNPFDSSTGGNLFGSSTGGNPFMSGTGSNPLMSGTGSNPLMSGGIPSTNPFETAQTATTSADTKVSTVNPFDVEFSLPQSSPDRRDRAESGSNLIALSPMNKETISQHYNLDLDSLFAGGVSNPTTSSLNSSAAFPSVSNPSSSLINSANKRASLPPTLPYSLPNPTQPAVSWPTSSASVSQSTQRPSPLPRTLNRENLTASGQLGAGPHPQLTSTNLLGVESLFSELSDRPSGHSLPMPTYRPPTLPPSLPARPSTSNKLHIKRVATPTSDLLDLGDDLSLPSFSSVELFDPLFTSSEEAKKELEETFSNISSRVSARLSYTVTDCEPDAEAQSLLQDPFSYEELSMTLMESSRIKGDDVLDEDVTEEITQPTAVALSLSQPSTPESQDPPQRPFKPRSLSTTSHKQLKITDNELLDEFTAFSVAVARLKADYKFDDKYTNLGILLSPTINIPSNEDLLVDIIVYTEMSPSPINLHLNVTTSIESILWNVMSRVSTDFLSVSVDDYILKVFAYSEYLLNDSCLSDYIYTHNCLKLNEKPKFSLHSVTSLHKPFLRELGDDDEPIYMIKGELHGDKSHKVEPKDLRLLYDIFCKHHETVNRAALELTHSESSYAKLNELSKLEVTAMLQSVKAIACLLLGAETLEVRTAVKQLGDTLRIVNDKVYDETKFIQLMDDFQNAMENLCNGVRNLITMYCATFHVTFSPSGAPARCREIKEVTQSLENILVHIGSVHRIPAHIRHRFDHFKVIVSLYYAGKKVIEHTDTDVYSTLENPLTGDTIYFDQWLELTDFPMCLVPLETRVVFTLCSMNTSQPVGGSGSNVPHKWNNIGWVAFMLFDFKRNVTQGGKLLSLWQGVANPLGATCSNIFQPNTTLLQVNLTDFGFDLRFPAALIDSAQLHRPQLGGGGTNPHIPDGDLKELNDILSKEDETLNSENKEFLWSRRSMLRNTPEALPKVLLSAPQLNYTGIHSVQETLDMWAPLSALEALRLLLPDFPCQVIRNHAVNCLKAVSSDEMCDYLPQLVQALKFENYHDSALSRLLLERSITSVRLAHQLYWYFKEGASQLAHRERYKLMFGGLVSVMGKSLREELEREELLVKHCNHLAEMVKEAKGDNRDKVLSREITQISDLLCHKTLRLPTHAGLEVNGLDLKLCTYFNSFTLPLRLVFKNAEHGAPSHYLMYKVGDDLRQDMIVMQMIDIMGKLWLQNDLDMRLVTFTCLPTGDKRGMVELINDCETLRKIQTHGGITGSFKDQPLADWLQKHNPTHADYSRAVENFTFSCAGYCVATYILGIGDRHNDNIMIKRTGHIFHIDFSKFLGDAQMFGNIKRDRTPFVLTPDMAYVINGGDKPTQKFQDFIDLCCEAFNVIRENSESLVTLLRLMTSSGVTGVTSQAIRYVKTALLPEQTNSEATASFTRMIEDSLKSRFVQVNFFIHNLAQLKFSSHSDGELLSFMPTSYSMATDGRIINVEIFDKQKRYNRGKHYVYIIKVHRENQREASLVYRRYSEFQEFYSKLVSLFPMASIPKLPGSVLLGRTHVQKVADKRKAELETFLRELLTLSREISEHDLLYTFFHPMLRDEADAPPPDATTFKDSALRPNVKVITGEVKMSIHYKQHALHIMIMHVKELSSETGDRPNPYVKLYLLPDPIKTSKRKTKTARATFHPTYNEMLEYRLPLQEVRLRTLQVTVWSAEMTGNEFLGALHLNLCDHNITSKEWIQWHKLSALHRIRS